MTERPILFSAKMVRAILDGSKTQTRRVIKPQPPVEAESVSKQLCSQQTPEFDGAWQWWAGKPQTPITKPLFCPYGAPGDQLWVRETCWAESTFDGDGVRYAADHVWRIIENTPEASEAWCKLGQYGGDAALDNQTNIGMRVPSIHMPRWASRITLRVTGVRVERLQDISEDDARAEGWPGPITETGFPIASPLAWFANAWNTINGPGAWDANPWVWVVAFERVKP